MPFVKAIVPEVDIAAGRVVVTPPAGLFEELPGRTTSPRPTARERRRFRGKTPADAESAAG